MKSMAMYKPGQGYWTRVMSALGLALIVLMGVAWLWKQLATVRLGPIKEAVYVQGGVAILVLGVAGWLGYWLIGVSPRVVEFMIATEGEMKKVNWSSKREIMGSTWVVIGVTAFLAVLCFAFDSIYQLFFHTINVLEK
jgi:preprotein translocase SecE subunit